VARRKPKEEHANHESWAIPYGDLVTLLLAVFVVMYAISSVNEGKYRVVSESLQSAFRGAPTSVLPIQLGERPATVVGPAVPELQAGQDLRTSELRDMAQQIETAMGDLIAQGFVDVNAGEGFVEVSIRSDILFPSGVAQLSEAAQPVIRLLGRTLQGFPNDIRVEGHTDNVPIRTVQFPSN
jgi:chemotaxis protein MotB